MLLLPGEMQPVHDTEQKEVQGGGAYDSSFFGLVMIGLRQCHRVDVQCS